MNSKSYRCWLVRMLRILESLAPLFLEVPLFYSLYFCNSSSFFSFVIYDPHRQSLCKQWRQCAEHLQTLSPHGIAPVQDVYLHYFWSCTVH